MQLGFADAGNDHPSTTSRQAYDLIADGFGPGANGPLVVVDRGLGRGRGGGVRRRCRVTDGVAQATPPQPSPDGEIHTSLAFPESSPQDEATTQLVHDLRDGPRATTHLVGGPTAAAVDFSVGGQRAASRSFIAVVVGLLVAAADDRVPVGARSRSRRRC